MYYPQAVAAGVERGWVFCLHGHNNSLLHGGFGPGEERAALGVMHETVTKAVGVPPRGWLGPALTETSDTPALLRKLGYTYVLDWCADHQPFSLPVPGMISVPYSVEINDIVCFVDWSMSIDAYGLRASLCRSSSRCFSLTARRLDA